MTYCTKHYVLPIPWFWVYLHGGSPVYFVLIITSQKAATGGSNAPEVWCNVFGTEYGPATGQQSTLSLCPLALLLFYNCIYPIPPHTPVNYMSCLHHLWTMYQDKVIECGRHMSVCHPDCLWVCGLLPVHIPPADVALALALELQPGQSVSVGCCGTQSWKDEWMLQRFQGDRKGNEGADGRTDWRPAHPLLPQSCRFLPSVHPELEWYRQKYHLKCLWPKENIA